MTRMMIAGFAIVALAGTACADEYVNGYYRSDGSYVAPHYRSSPNRHRYDNYSSQGNTNPYTFQPGYQPHEFSSPPAYNSGYGGYGGYGFGGSDYKSFFDIHTQ